MNRVMKITKVGSFWYAGGHIMEMDSEGNYRDTGHGLIIIMGPGLLQED